MEQDPLRQAGGGKVDIPAGVTCHALLWGEEGGPSHLSLLFYSSPIGFIPLGNKSGPWKGSFHSDPKRGVDNQLFPVWTQEVRQDAPWI